jgi:hypothetical protein
MVPEIKIRSGNVLSSQGANTMTKKKGPKMAHPNPALEALTQEFDNIIDRVAEQVDEKELAERERKADEFIEGVRARASRQERA